MASGPGSQEVPVLQHGPASLDVRSRVGMQQPTGGEEENGLGVKWVIRGEPRLPWGL